MHCGGGQGDMSGQSVGLRSMLLGAPLDGRDEEGSQDAHLNKQLDMHLNGLIELIPRVYGDMEPCRQAVMELRAIGQTRDAACKRAALLYGIAREREMCDYWSGRQADGSAALAKDLHGRVLPFVVPRFFKHSCQCPDSFVLFSMLLSEMWEGEKLGNWPRAP
jgi:hypothetical protein